MKSINKIILVLIGADLMINMATGFVDPIFSVFLVGSITNGTIELVGTAVAIMWLIKSIMRIPIARYLDKTIGEDDDFYSMVFGFLLYSVCQFLYMFAKTPTHIYAIQVLLGVAGAFAFTPWYGFFSRHIDRRKENFEWSISNSLVGFGVAFAGFTTGIVAQRFGFTIVFAVSGITSLVGTALLLFMKSKLEKPHPDNMIS